MYDAKAAGRSGVAVYARRRAEPLERLSLTSRLRRADRDGELRAALAADRRRRATGELRALEALVRWQDP